MINFYYAPNGPVVRYQDEFEAEMVNTVAITGRYPRTVYHMGLTLTLAWVVMLDTLTLDCAVGFDPLDR